ncbi:hypothetical protein BGS_0702 [Beggiatoa sp. SS]|nr:hypothetical protein BGS_0702 [Beggiatoa sp. SS]
MKFFFKENMEAPGPLPWAGYFEKNNEGFYVNVNLINPREASN